MKRYSLNDSWRYGVLMFSVLVFFFHTTTNDLQYVFIYLYLHKGL